MRGEKSTVGTSRNFSAKGNSHHRERIPDLNLLLLRKSSLSFRAVDRIELSQSARDFPATAAGTADPADEAPRALPTRPVCWVGCATTQPGREGPGGQSWDHRYQWQFVGGAPMLAIGLARPDAARCDEQWSRHPSRVKHERSTFNPGTDRTAKMTVAAPQPTGRIAGSGLADGEMRRA